MYPFWKYLPAGLAHELAPVGLRIHNLYAGFSETPIQSPFTFKNIQFKNRLGIAGGVDKNAVDCLAWQHAGCGFVEVGTITPLPQNANPGKILDRDWDKKCLWNKMGFPNHGALEIHANLLSHTPELSVPVLINIGKNRWTESFAAIDDYVHVATKFRDLADIFVVNVSSPNTKGLRDLQTKTFLVDIISAVARVGRPVLVKLSPDLSREQLHESLEAGLDGGAAGFTLTNTTLSRPENLSFPKEGGASGAALASLSKQVLVESIKALGPARKDLLIISAGGILSPEDVQERINLGADLVQCYSSLVFSGPNFFRQVIERGLL